jgi:hypothetical protein
MPIARVDGAAENARDLYFRSLHCVSGVSAKFVILDQSRHVSHIHPITNSNHNASQCTPYIIEYRATIRKPHRCPSLE